jgi:hypothetical protein
MCKSIKNSSYTDRNNLVATLISKKNNFRSRRIILYHCKLYKFGFPCHLIFVGLNVKLRSWFSVGEVNSLMLWLAFAEERRNKNKDNVQTAVVGTVGSYTQRHPRGPLACQNKPMISVQFPTMSSSETEFRACIWAQMDAVQYPSLHSLFIATVSTDP